MEVGWWRQGTRLATLCQSGCWVPYWRRGSEGDKLHPITIRWPLVSALKNSWVLVDLSDRRTVLKEISFWMFFSMPIGLEEKETDHSFPMFHLLSLTILPFLSFPSSFLQRHAGEYRNERSYQRGTGVSLTIPAKSKQVCIMYLCSLSIMIDQ